MAQSVLDWWHHHPLDHRVFGSGVSRHVHRTGRSRARVLCSQRSLVSRILCVCEKTRTDQGTEPHSGLVRADLSPGRVSTAGARRRHSTPYSRSGTANRPHTGRCVGCSRALKALRCSLFTRLSPRAYSWCVCTLFTSSSSLCWDQPLNNALFLPVETAECGL
jgi:hypothetical protein